ncbi:MAG: amidohydrolase [Planctomycetes bacterium]|nr:amidohydrolase [Planctomycetota bacterium]
MIQLHSIKNLIDNILPDIVNLRHSIHENPELALHETDTAALIRRTLEPTALRLLDPFLGTDVVGLLDGRGEGRNVTLRADIDALPLEEKTGLPYQSKRDGLMHACGHDGHTAMLVGAALVLGELSRELDGSVRFVFQPGEEVAAAGRDLVEKGVLVDPVPDAIFALHAWSGMAVGAIASRPGVIMAAADFFHLRILGKGGHASMPEAAIDPILTGARVVEALQSIVARRVSALEPVVVSVCHIEAGTNSNIIPDSLEMEGTVRYVNPAIAKKIPAEMERIVKGVCDAAGASYEFGYVEKYMPTINDESIVALGKRVVQRSLGPERWVDLDKPSMGAEDFAFYIRERPGAMFRLGMGEGTVPVHNPHFDFNDDALEAGIVFLVSAALEVLREQGAILK